jgi:hypothetical protein
MKKLIKISVLFLSINLFFSCDCQKTATGIVYDADTKLPLANVIYNGSNNLSFENKTNEKGEFRILKMDGRRCKIIKTFFKKENYKTLKIKIRNRTENNSIYLEVKKN